MTLVAVTLVLLVCAVLQAWLPSFEWLGLAKAPVLLSAVLYYALARGRVAMLWAALAGGLIQDSLGFTPLGCTSFCYSVLALGIYAFRDLLFKDSVLTVVALTAFGSAATVLATWLLLAPGGFERVPEIGIPGWVAVLKAAGSAGLALVAAPPVVAVARGLDRLVGAEEEAPA